jgi:hypothetical protein
MMNGPEKSDSAIRAKKPANKAVQSAAERVEQRAGAYFSPSWTAFQADRGRGFSVIVDGVSF